LAQEFVLTLQLPEPLLLRPDPTMPGKGLRAILGHLVFPTGQTPWPHAQVTLDLGRALAAGLQQPQRFPFELARVRFSDLAHDDSSD